MKEIPKIAGRGFGGGEPKQQYQQQPQITNTNDNIRSTDHIEFVLGLGQGQFEGLKDNSAKNFFVGETPLVSPDGTPNFNNFKLDFYDGDGVNNTVVLSQTGAALSHNVNINLSKNLPVVRQGTVSASVEHVDTLPETGSYIGKVYYVALDGTTKASGYWLWTDKGWRRTNNPYVNFLQFRFVISQLYSQNKSGNYNHSADVKVEIKRSDEPDSAYVPAFYRSASNSTVLTRKIGGGAVDEPAPSSPGIIDTIQFYGKTTSQASKTYRVPVQASAVPYTVRVTLLTEPDYQNGDTVQKANITFESFQEITSAALRLDDLAFIHGLAQASDQFSSLPDFSGIYKCMRVRVPTNYDPVTRTYDGTWNGTFKIAYTNNPAWCLYETITNDDWGISSFNPMTMDKYDIYEVAKWCDTMVPDGKGGLQPRYTLNVVINEPRPAMDMVRYIAGTFNGVLMDDGNGTAYLRVDKDDPATHLFVPENVINGAFEYSYTDITTRHNYVTVSFINEDLNYLTDYRTLTLPEHIAEYGPISTDLIAVGAKDAQEAMRRAMYRLITATTENLIVKFRVPRLGQYVHPFQVALIADPDLGYGLTGRLKTIAAGRMSATLRDPLYLEAGVSYIARFSVPNPAYPTNSTQEFLIVTRRVTTASTGNVSTLNFNEPLPELPEKAAFSLEQYTGLGIGLPKPFRILSVEPSAENPDEITIEAIEINRSKWPQIDNLTAGGVIEYSSMSLRTVSMPENLTVTPTYHDGVVDLDIKWDRINGQMIKAYTLQYAFNGGVPQTLSDTGATEFQMINRPVGAYTFWLRAVGMNGDKSPTAGYRIDLTDPAIANPGGVADVSNIRYDNGYWKGQNLKLVWDKSSPANFDHYKVEFRNPSTGAVLRTIETTTESVEYTGVMNALDNGGSPSRAVLVGVTVVTNNFDIDGLPQSSVGATFLAHNPAPAAPKKLKASWIEGGLRLEFDTPTDSDWVNSHVWVDLDHSWTSQDEPSFILSGNPILLPQLDRSKNYYIHVAHNDEFGRNLIPSDELAVVSGVPNAPGNPQLAATRKKIGDISAKTTIVATWEASTTPELVSDYVVQIRTGPSAEWKDYVTKELMLTDIRYSAPMTDAYQMRVKAVSGASISSEWSAIVNCGFTDDTAPPADPTDLTVKGAYNSMFVEWKNPTDEDFAGVELYVGTTSTRPGSPTISFKSDRYALTELASGAQRWFWLRAYDYSGNFGNYVGPVSGLAIALPTLDTVPGPPGTPTGLTIGSTSTIAYDGTTIAKLTASWTPASEADFLQYEIAVKEGVAGNYVQFFSSTSNYEWLVKPNTTYYVKVRAIDLAQNKSPYAAELNTTTASDAVAPGSPSSFSIIAGFENLYLSWTNPGDKDLAYIEILEGVTNDRSFASVIARVSSNTFTRQGLPGLATRYYWLRAVDTSGNFGAYFPVSSTGGLSASTLNINSGTQIANGVITTAHITVNSLNGDRITAGTLDATKITAGSVLAGTIVVGSGGPALSTVATNAATGAADPVGRINAGSTTIDPGKILISGGTTLASWRNGTDATKIEGGSIAANTITANKMSIGARGIEIVGIEFSANPTTNVISWTAGTINYINDAGTVTSTNITAGNVTWTTGVRYLYWVQGATTISTTTTIGTAYGANNVVMGTYRGGSDSVINYGRTVVDGSDIVTGTITGDRLWAGEVISLTAQIKDAIITNAKVADLSVGKLTSGTIGAQTITLVDSKFVIDGTTQRMTIKDALAATRVELGALTGGGYGVVIKDGAGNVMLSSGTTSGIAGTSILDASITNAKIADATIQAAKIGSVDASTITTGSMNAARITAGSITADRITLGGVTTDRISSGAITNAASYYSTADVYDGTPGTEIASVTLTTEGGIVNVIGYLQFAYTVYTDIYAYW